MFVFDRQALSVARVPHSDGEVPRAGNDNVREGVVPNEASDVALVSGECPHARLLLVVPNLHCPVV
jgi:hypothetical protein